ncbi:hypothetical protein [Larkinella soli]|uniref:hypothetical protein n=1 Tax=Larkinella soli TaxID=1770527 RepID=UPI000FFC74C5|nr:hypothetical protein [Larkinella soli]
MKTFSRNVFYALMAISVFGACSRPYATYQKMPVERFTSRQETPATPPAQLTVSENAVVEAAPISPAAPAPSDLTSLTVKPADLTVLSRTLDEAVARNDNKLAGNRKLSKRVAHIQSLLAEAAKKPAGAVQTTKHKMNLVERMMVKKIDKKIQKTLAPDAAKAVGGLTKIGALVALIGLVFVFIPAVDTIGIILLIVGVALVLLGLLIE